MTAADDRRALRALSRHLRTAGWRRAASGLDGEDLPCLRVDHDIELSIERCILFSGPDSPLVRAFYVDVNDRAVVVATDREPLVRRPAAKAGRRPVGAESLTSTFQVKVSATMARELAVIGPDACRALLADGLQRSRGSTP